MPDVLTPEEQELADLQDWIAVMEEVQQSGYRSNYLEAALRQARALVALGLSRLPEEPAPVVIDLWDGDWSASMDENGCLMYKPLYDLAEEWKDSDSRFERYAASFINQNSYMILVPGRTDQDAEWFAKFEVAYDASPQKWFFGPYGYASKALWAEYANHRGVGDSIPNAYIPYVGRIIPDYYQVAHDKFVALNGTRMGKGKFWAVGANAVRNMDRGTQPKWSGWSAATGPEDTSSRGNPYRTFTNPE